MSSAAGPWRRHSVQSGKTPESVQSSGFLASGRGAGTSKSGEIFLVYQACRIMLDAWRFNRRASVYRGGRSRCPWNTRRQEELIRW